MMTIFTSQGRRINLILERELRSPIQQGEHVRAYCHIHGSDHQRSLSITRASGWGHCFNAACAATVLVAEWNRPLANRLLRQASWGKAAPSSSGSRVRPVFVQPMLLPPPRPIPSWQQEERSALHTLERQMQQALTSTSWAKR